MFRHQDAHAHGGGQVAQSLANYAALLRETGREANKMEARAKEIRAKSE